MSTKIIKKDFVCIKASKLQGMSNDEIWAALGMKRSTSNNIPSSKGTDTDWCLPANVLVQLDTDDIIEHM